MKLITYRLFIGLLFCLVLPVSAAGQSTKRDSLMDALSKSGPDTQRVIIIHELCNSWMDEAAYEKIFAYADTALALSKKLGFKKGEGHILSSMSNALYNQGRMPESMNCLLKALEAYQAAGFKRGTGRSHTNLGVIYFGQGNYPEALENHYAALRIMEEIGDTKGAAKCYVNIGLVQAYTGMNSEALENYREALNIYEKSGKPGPLVVIYNSIGLTYYNMRNYTAALENDQRALEYAKRAGDKKGLATCYGNIANVYNAMGNYKEGLKNNLAALDQFTRNGDRKGMAGANLNIGVALLKQKKYAESGNYLHKGLELSKLVGSKEHLKECYGSRSQLDSATGNFRDALAHFKLFIAYRDSISNEENTKKNVQAQMQYDFDKKQAADSIRNAEKLKQEAIRHDQEIQQQRLFTIGGIAGFLLMVVVAGVSFNAYRQKQRANGIIQQQKLLVEEKQKEILDSIYYARRIQQSLLPTERYIQRCLYGIRGNN